MDKRYQVFVSSTYTDLTEERAAVIQAILELEHFPAGMELFPAANNDQWTLIKQVIDLSDYYVVVVAGRYGSLDAEGISYTEKEYDYAVETGTPILGFVHGDPGKIESGKTEPNEDAREKLATFRAKVETRMVKYFTNPDQLGGQVTSSLVREIKKNERTGWVRGDLAMTVETEREILQLRQQLAKSEADRESAQKALVEDASDLQQGSDQVSATVSFSGYKEGVRKTQSIMLTMSWDKLFGEIGPLLIDESTEKEVRHRAAIEFASLTEGADYKELKSWTNLDVEMTVDSWERIKIQFRALGLIEVGQKKRQINDKSKYLRLTDRGDRHLVYLRAARRVPDKTA